MLFAFTTHGLTEFTYRSDNTWRCKLCATEAVRKRRKRLKEMAAEYKGGGCKICGYNKCLNALEFHHTNPSEKDFGIAMKGHTRSWERVKEELDKCVMVCANCHTEIHAELHENYKKTKKLKE